MSVALTSVKDDLAPKLVVDTDADNTPAVHVTSGTGSLFMVEIDATAGVATTDEPTCYVKIIDASSNVTGGTNSSSIPELVLYAPIGEKTTYVISGGWAFSSGLSFWNVTSAALSSQTPPTAEIKVTVLSS